MHEGVVLIVAMYMYSQVLIFLLIGDYLKRENFIFVIKRICHSLVLRSYLKCCLDQTSFNNQLLSFILIQYYEISKVKC